MFCAVVQKRQHVLASRTKPAAKSNQLAMKQDIYALLCSGEHMQLYESLFKNKMDKFSQ